jgi:hypothetical protein
MKNLLIVTALLLLISGNALAGSGYDSCIKEEKALKAEEVSACSGLSYLLNPSACFAKRRVLKEYPAGKCRQIGVAEGVDFNAQPVIPERKGSSAGTANKVSNSGTVAVKKAEPVTAQQDTTIEQLKAENTRLKAEIIRLTAELEQFGKACR